MTTKACRRQQILTLMENPGGSMVEPWGVSGAQKMFWHFCIFKAIK